MSRSRVRLQRSANGCEPLRLCANHPEIQDVVLTEKTVAKRGGCYYCPGCGHKFWHRKTQSGEFSPSETPCMYCVADTVR